MTGRIDLNSADLATLINEVGLPPHRAELLQARRPFWDFSEIGRLAGFGPKTLRRLSTVATLVPPRAFDINSCSAAELAKLPGVGPVLARRIVAERPFSDLEDLTRVKGIGARVLPGLRQRVTALPPRLLDVNTASEGELRHLPGVGKATARRLVEKRPFAGFEHMTGAVNLSKDKVGRLSRLVTFGPDREGSLSPGGGVQAAAPPVSGVPTPEAFEHEARRAAGLEDEPFFHAPPPQSDARRPGTSEARVSRPDVLRDVEWVVVDDQAYPEPQSTTLLPELRPLTLSPVEFEASLRREVMRRVPLFVSGWVFAGAILLLILALYALNLVRFGPERPAQMGIPSGAVRNEPAPTLTVRSTAVPAPTMISVQVPATNAVAPTAERPPSATPAPAEPSPTALPLFLAPLAHLGPQIFTELFAPGDYWELESNELANMEIELDRLTITMQTSGAISWTRNGFSGSDFYYQGTVIPEDCQLGDYFGLVFRSVDDFNLYLFGVSCDGQYRLVRRVNGQFDILVDFTPAPSILKDKELNLLAVLATGPELHFYANDAHLTGVHDSTLSEGRFGVFTKSLANPNLTVHFDDLAAWSIAP